MFLSTLSKREFSAGMAEVVKYGMIGNSVLFQNITDRSTPFDASTPELQELIHTCCSEKAKVVEEDERETVSGMGRSSFIKSWSYFCSRHFEAVAGYGDYLHGESG